MFLSRGGPDTGQPHFQHERLVLFPLPHFAPRQGDNAAREDQVVEPTRIARRTDHDIAARLASAAQPRTRPRLQLAIDAEQRPVRLPATGAVMRSLSPAPTMLALPKAQGTTLRRFAIEAAHGRGAMGGVGLAWDHLTRENVVVKTAHEHLRGLRDVDVDAMLADEADVMRAYHAHDSGAPGREHLATSVGIVMQEGKVMLGQKKAPGRPLNDQKIDVKTATLAMINVAKGLRHLHSAGYMHLDIKPSNILMEPGRPETATVIDFGLARQIDPDGTALAIGGTPYFAPPEQVSEIFNSGLHSFGRVDQRADVYALGQTLSRLIEWQVGPRSLKPIIARATHANPALRYGSMQDLINALERVQL